MLPAHPPAWGRYLITAKRGKMARKEGRRRVGEDEGGGTEGRGDCRRRELVFESRRIRRENRRWLPWFSTNESIPEGESNVFMGCFVAIEFELSSSSRQLFYTCLGFVCNDFIHCK